MNKNLYRTGLFIVLFVITGTKQIHNNATVSLKDSGAKNFLDVTGMDTVLAGYRINYSEQAHNFPHSKTQRFLIYRVSKNFVFIKVE